MDMKELRTSMDTIRKTAGSFIDSMTEVIQRLMREQPELSLSAMKQAEILIDRVEQERTLLAAKREICWSIMRISLTMQRKRRNLSENWRRQRRFQIFVPPQKSAGIYKKKSSFSLMAWWE